MKSQPPKSSFRKVFFPAGLILFILAGAFAVVWALRSEPGLSPPVRQDAPITPLLQDDHPPPPPNEFATMPELPAHPHTGLQILETTRLSKNYEMGEERFDALVEIAASNVTLDCGGHRISGFGGYGLLVNHVSNVTIENCHFTGHYQGVLADGADNLTILNSTFTVSNNGLHAHQCDHLFLDGLALLSNPAPSRAFAVEIKDSKNTTVRRTQINGFEQGLLFYGAVEFVAKDNRIEGITETGIGTFKMDAERISTHGLIQNNTILDCMMGLEIHAGSRDLRIVNNRVTGCKMALRLYDCSDTPSFAPIRKIHLSGNIFTDNREGNDVLVSDPKEIVWEK